MSTQPYAFGPLVATLAEKLSDHGLPGYRAYKRERDQAVVFEAPDQGVSFDLTATGPEDEGELTVNYFRGTSDWEDPAFQALFGEGAATDYAELGGPASIQHARGLILARLLALRALSQG